MIASPSPSSASVKVVASAPSWLTVTGRPDALSALLHAGTALAEMFTRTFVAGSGLQFTRTITLALRATAEMATKSTTARGLCQSGVRKAPHRKSNSSRQWRTLGGAAGDAHGSRRLDRDGVHRGGEEKLVASGDVESSRQEAAKCGESVKGLGPSAGRCLTG